MPTITLTDPEAPPVAAPDPTTTQPVFPDWELPEPNHSVPDAPADVTAALATVTAPVPPLALEPERTTIDPPTAVLVASPPDNSTDPPAPDVLLPTMTLTEPATPPVAAPLPMRSQPVLPELALPEASVIEPELPVDVDDADWTIKEPDPELMLDPDSMLILPPSEVLNEVPAESDTLPPAPDPLLPTMMLTDPARPVADEPLLTLTQPALPETEEPEPTATLPETPDDRAGADVNEIDPEPPLKLEPEDIISGPPTPSAVVLPLDKNNRPDDCPELLPPTTMLIVPATPPVDAPVDIHNAPLLPDTELPERSTASPEIPEDETDAVLRRTDPEPPLTLEPLTTVTAPPTKVPEDDPDESMMAPAEPLLSPRTILTDPARPPVETPDAITILPLQPFEAPPVDRTILPLAPKL